MALFLFNTANTQNIAIHRQMCVGYYIYVQVQHLSACLKPDICDKIKKHLSNKG